MSAYRLLNDGVQCALNSTVQMLMFAYPEKAEAIHNVVKGKNLFEEIKVKSETVDVIDCYPVVFNYILEQLKDTAHAFKPTDIPIVRVKHGENVEPALYYTDTELEFLKTHSILHDVEVVNEHFVYEPIFQQDGPHLFEEVFGMASCYGLWHFGNLIQVKCVGGQDYVSQCAIFYKPGTTKDNGHYFCMGWDETKGRIAIFGEYANRDEPPENPNEPMNAFKYADYAESLAFCEFVKGAILRMVWYSAKQKNQNDEPAIESEEATEESNSESEESHEEVIVANTEEVAAESSGGFLLSLRRLF